ncbi:large conductance mechanosensitive channel protein MscL [Vagococcus xieshaowenii]|uniref:Large-conductance mechanosensitive channel n=1 Tax=Vagococcus xieshaowenii TaxID=2562451 RepID=A0AAJ5EEX7_9ENTE|nr:large conductance mechanosensitive channel protein MscL [Vagococcus xieshaowenii]QCA28072.1 large conductance mechanosensitive channel protein MscL [Vagococcus xieshaowenii]TFZ40115.1 large conductance mechanosensitive channel protein MscL [Vagococcus xieshaowenii]
MIKEFKDFITKGNAFDLAIGVLVGGAFNNIVKALTDSVLTPLVSFFIRFITGSNSNSTKIEGLAVPLGETGLRIDFGVFIGAIIQFLITMVVLFFIVKTINKLRDLGTTVLPIENETEEEPEPTQEELLQEIVQLLKKDHESTPHND